MHPSLRLLAAATLLALPASARAQCAPSGAAFDLGSRFFAFARVNGAVFDFSCLIAPAGDGTAVLSFARNATPLATHALPGGATASAFLANFSITFDPTGVAGGGTPPSPNVAWSITTRTAVRPDTPADPVFDLAFAFGMPIAARTYATGSASQGFSVTNSNARAAEGVSLTPAGAFAPLAAPADLPAALFGATGPLSRQSVYDQLLLDGVPVAGTGTAACQLADPNQPNRARQAVCDSDTGIQPLGAHAASLGVVIQYRQYGVVGVTANGTTIATPQVVPEPATLALLATGLLATGAAAGARRRGHARAR